MTPVRRVIALSCCLSIALVPVAQAAPGTLISTEQLATAEAAPAVGGAHTRLLDLLDRADVAQALQARGVDPQAARLRVAALTDAEAAQLALQMDQAPAGGDVLGTIVFIFVLLLVTDILGFTKVFPFTRSIR